MAKLAANPLSDPSSDQSRFRSIKRFAVDHSLTGVFILAAGTSVFGLADDGDTILGVDASKFELGYAAVVAAIGIVLSENRFSQQSRLQQSMDQAASDKEAALQEVSQLDSTLGRVLELRASEYFRQFGLCKGDRLTIYGRSEVGDENEFIRLARFSTDPELAKAGREVVPAEGYLETAWREGTVSVKLKDTHLWRQHQSGGLQDKKVFEALSMEVNSYEGFRVGIAGQEPAGVVMCEGAKETCEHDHEVTSPDNEQALSLVELIVATTKQRENEDE